MPLRRAHMYNPPEKVVWFQGLHLGVGGVCGGIGVYEGWVNGVTINHHIATLANADDPE